VTWPDSLRIFLAVSLILVSLSFWITQARTGIRASQVKNQFGLLDCLTLTTIILLSGTLFLSIFSVTPKHSELFAEKIDSYFDSPTQFLGNAEPQGNGASGNGNRISTSANWLLDEHGSRSLRNGEHTLSLNRPEVYLWPKTQTDARRLQQLPPFLRTFTLATYSRGTWAPLPHTPKTLTAGDGNTVILRTNTNPARSPIHYEVYHTVKESSRNLAVTVPHLLTITQPFVRRDSPESYRLPPTPPDTTHHRYFASSAPLTVSSLPDRYNLSVEQNFSPAYLQLPNEPTIRKALNDICHTTSGTIHQRLTQIRTHLQRHHRYTLSPASSPANDPLADFLTGPREGYCEHFSTAAALLARNLGIPSRIAYGWSGGRYYQNRNVFVFRSREAHAWTEVHLAEYGWVIFETTPPDRDEAAPSTAGNDELPPLSPGLDFSPDPDLDETQANLPPLFIPTLTGGGIAIAILLALLIVRRPTTVKNHSHPATIILPSPPGYYAYFQRVSPIPSGRTLRQHLEILSKSPHPPEFANELLTYHYGVSYGNSRRSRQTEKHLITYIKQWARLQNEA